MDKLFIKEGKIKYRKHITVEKDGGITVNPTDEMLFEDGWELYVAPEPTKEELLARAKRDKKREIEYYD